MSVGRKRTIGCGGCSGGEKTGVWRVQWHNVYVAAHTLCIGGRTRASMEDEILLQSRLVMSTSTVI